MGFFRYPGGKQRLRPYIIQELDKFVKNHDTYNEPFWGAGNVGGTFIKDKNLNCWINELNLSLVKLWECVLKYHKELIELVNQYQPSADDFYQFRQEILSDNYTTKISDNETLDIGFKKLACHQMSFAGCGEMARGCIGGKKQLSDKANARWYPHKIVVEINKLHFNITQHNCKITNLSFQDVLKHSESMLVYLDPPYPTYTKSDACYKYMMTKENHEELALILKNSHHDWVMSNENSEFIRNIYSWANIKEVAINYSMSKTEKKELIITKCQ